MQKRFITELRIRSIVGYEIIKHVGSSSHGRHEEGAALCGWVPVHGERAVLDVSIAVVVLFSASSRLSNVVGAQAIMNISSPSGAGGANATIAAISHW